MQIIFSLGVLGYLFLALLGSDPLKMYSAADNISLCPNEISLVASLLQPAIHKNFPCFLHMIQLADEWSLAWYLTQAHPLCIGQDTPKV
jgi:hypothetical protein